MDIVLNTIFIFLGIWLVLISAYWLYWQYHQSTADAKLAVTKRLVAVAEQTFTGPGRGNHRFTYVINKLTHLYPHDEYDDLAELIEAAVFALNQAKQGDPYP